MLLELLLAVARSDTAGCEGGELTLYLRGSLDGEGSSLLVNSVVLTSVGEGLSHVGACAHELPVKLEDRLRVLYGAGLHVAALLERNHEVAISYHNTVSQSVQQTLLIYCHFYVSKVMFNSLSPLRNQGSC